MPDPPLGDQGPRNVLQMGKQAQKRCQTCFRAEVGQGRWAPLLRGHRTQVTRCPFLLRGTHLPRQHGLLCPWDLGQLPPPRAPDMPSFLLSQHRPHKESWGTPGEP